MRKYVLCFLLLLALCFQPGTTTSPAQTAENGIGLARRERVIQGIEYLMGEIEFYAEHGLPRSLAGRLIYASR